MTHKQTSHEAAIQHTLTLIRPLLPKGWWASEAIAAFSTAPEFILIGQRKPAALQSRDDLKAWRNLQADGAVQVRERLLREVPGIEVWRDHASLRVYLRKS